MLCLFVIAAGAYSSGYGDFKAVINETDNTTEYRKSNEEAIPVKLTYTNAVINDHDNQLEHTASHVYSDDGSQDIPPSESVYEEEPDPAVPEPESDPETVPELQPVEDEEPKQEPEPVQETDEDLGEAVDLEGDDESEEADVNEETEVSDTQHVDEEGALPASGGNVLIVLLFLWLLIAAAYCMKKAIVR